MLQRIKVNLEAVEAILYFWQAASEKENVAEKFFYDVADMPGLTCAYDSEFNGESVRRALSAIKNREPFVGNKKERVFWNNNMWMMEDFEYTNAMAAPVKKLNLGNLVGKLSTEIGADKYEELEVIFSPLHSDEYIIKENKLVINFFRVKPDFVQDKTFIGEIELNEYIEQKLKELINK
ncbi:TDE2712 family protein [Clostridium sp.]